MMYSIVDARKQLGGLVRQASAGRERIYLTDHGQPMAAIISVSELEQLEDRVAFAEYQADKAAGKVDSVPLREVVDRYRR